MKKSSKNLLLVISFVAIAVLGLNTFEDSKVNSTDSQTKAKSNPIPVIGIVLPMEHAALTDMLVGFNDSLKKTYSNPVKVQIQNAQGDIKLQRSILERFKGQKVDVVVTIGTSTTLMGLSIINTQPIVSLAAMLPATELENRSDYLRNVQDEVGGEKKLAYLKKVFPNLKKISILYHSANEKNYPEIKEITELAKTQGISIQAIAIQTLPELQMAARSIASDSNLILILKDHLIASGVKLIYPIAESKKIPLVASDEGSVKEGAAFALGVSERKIGETGGKLVGKILAGTAVADLPTHPIQGLTVFYNEEAAERQGVSISHLQKVTKNKGYLFEAVQQK